MVQPGIAALSRIGELLKLKTEEEVSGDKKTGRIEDIVCSDVSFAYTEKPVIRNFNMRAHKNTKIVLSGKNGSGKTTVAKLLLGFYKNYSGSLLDNIRYISPDLKEQEVMAALKKADLTISEFENGLHSMVNENGKNLSGGQRQKIALARMIVKNPDVMIFDEATSNLDVAASNLLKQSVHSIFADKICIIISRPAAAHEAVNPKKICCFFCAHFWQISKSSVLDSEAKKGCHFFRQRAKRSFRNALLSGKTEPPKKFLPESPSFLLFAVL